MQSGSVKLLTAVLIALTLAGCNDDVETRSDVPPVDSDLVTSMTDFAEIVECPQSIDLSQSQVHSSGSGPDPSKKGERSAKQALLHLLATDYRQSGWRAEDFGRLSHDDGVVLYGNSDDFLNIIVAVEVAPVAAHKSWMVTKLAYCNSAYPS